MNGLLYIGMLLVSIYLGALRLLTPVVSQVHKEDIFKDLAHLWVGGMLFLGAGVHILWKQKRIIGRRPLAADCFWIGVLLTVLEFVAFKIYQP